MPDQLEQLFADLRAETVPQVRPPGTAAARRTVRNRRAVAAVAVVAAVVVVVGGVQLAVHSGPSPQVAASSAANAVARAEAAVADKPGKTWSGVLTKPTYIALPALDAGEFEIYVACTGSGSIGLDVRVGNRSRSGQTISCADSPSVEQVPLVVTTRTSFTLLLNGTDEPAYAVKLGPGEEPGENAPTPPPSEESSFNAGLAGDLFNTGGQAHLMTTESSQVIEAGTYAKGDLFVSYACAGPGIITFTIVTTPIGAGIPTRSEDPLECSSLGSVRSDVPTPLDARSTVTITATPDSDAENHAGWAYLIR